MLKIALTGNIASGKSTVQKILENKGFKVFDTDFAAHKLLEELDEIKTAFPECIVSGKVSREKLGQLVFNNPEAKAKLESIIHPEIKREIEIFFSQNISEKVVFVAIPLLFEADMAYLFDKSLLIYSEDTLREERIISRNHYSVEYAKIRMQSQVSQDEKKHLCDFVIYNNGTLSELENSVNRFLSFIVSLPQNGSDI